MARVVQRYQDVQRRTWNVKLERQRLVYLMRGRA
jgi:hypothetical protein